MVKRKTHTEQVPERKNTIKLVVKSNDLVEARYMFNAWEHRFFGFLMTLIGKDDSAEDVYRIWYRDIKNEYKLKSNNSYDLLREAARSLRSKSVYIGWIKDEFRRGREYSLFEFVDYLEGGQSGSGMQGQEYVDVKIGQDIKRYLVGLKEKFTSYDSRNTYKLKPYATRIYELLKQFENLGARTIRVQDLKDMFLIENEYPKFSTFNQSVIQPSIKAINEHTDLYINPKRIKKIKKGRRVDALQFTIQQKTPQEIKQIRKEEPEPLLIPEQGEEGVKVDSIIVEENVVDNLFEEFREVVVGSFGVSPQAFRNMLKTGNYNKPSIQQAINVTRRAKARQEIRTSIAGFFLKALKDGYTDAKEESRKKQKKKEAKMEKLKLNLAKLEDERNQKINSKIRDLTSKDETVTRLAIEKLTSNTLMKAVISKKEKALGRALEIDDYRSDERLRGMVINNIVDTQKEHFQEILDKYEPQIDGIRNELQKLGRLF